jgi:hypothetical protein
MPENESPPKAQKTIEYVLPVGGLRHVYSNNIQMATSNFDVRVLFGEIDRVSDDKVIVEQQVQVTMTWLEAKILSDFLQANVKAHEELNGPLKLPKNADRIVVPDTFQVAK